MSPSTSLYLDLVRFGAAMEVFLAHYSSGRLSGGLFWQVQDFAHTAVIVFFVLSGLVIAYATDEKDNTPRDYFLSRFSRLYSVVLPAIILTLIADAIGTRVAPELYTSSWGYADSHPLLRVTTALTFTSEVWFLDLQPFSNGPYWSLPYEFWYYVLFGVLYFLRGRQRWLWSIVVMAIAGPRILFLLPIWLIGVGAYRIMLKARLSATTGWALWLGSLAAFVLLEIVHIPWLYIHMPDGLFTTAGMKPEWAPYATGADFINGFLFAANFIGFRFAGDALLPLLKRFKRPIRWFAGLTFALYLFHMPLLQVFAAVSPLIHSSWMHQLYLFVATFGTVVALTYVSEHRRADLRAWLARLIPERAPSPVSKTAAPAAIHERS